MKKGGKTICKLCKDIRERRGLPPITVLWLRTKRTEETTDWMPIDEPPAGWPPDDTMFDRDKHVPHGETCVAQRDNFARQYKVRKGSIARLCFDLFFVYRSTSPRPIWAPHRDVRYAKLAAELVDDLAWKDAEAKDRLELAKKACRLVHDEWSEKPSSEGVAKLTDTPA